MFGYFFDSIIIRNNAKFNSHSKMFIEYINKWFWIFKLEIGIRVEE